jgi:cation diffusion facilitator family transporter
MKASFTANYRKGEEISRLGLLFTIVLTIIKGVAGIVGRSQAMTADALESVGDMFATGIALVSLKISKRPIDESHPYGHGKAEILAAAAIGLLIISAGVVIALSAARSIIQGNLPTPGVIALIAAIITIVSKEAMYQYVHAVGKKLGSPAVLAIAWDHRKDALTSMATLAGIIGARMGLSILDPIAAIVVTVFIFGVGFRIVKDAAGGLMDAAVAPEVRIKIQQIAEKMDGVEHVNNVRCRSMGQYMLVDIKLQIDSEASVEQGHTIATAVKGEIINKIDLISDVMVHVSPHKRHE